MSPRTWFGILAVATLLLPFSLAASPTLKEDPEPPGPRFTNSIGMKFVLVRKGKFKMGSPKTEKERINNETEHQVEITKDFYLGVTEVTQKQYRAIMGENPAWFRKGGGGEDRVKGLNTDDFPVEIVSWEETQEFLIKLNALAAENEAGRVYRLPTEAEWEYACRGGIYTSDKPFHLKFPSISISSAQANFNGIGPYGGGARRKYLQRTCKVGSYEPNSLGIHDMHGNVLEWCSDWYDEKYYATSPSKDPTGPESGRARVLRGGCWYLRGLGCRAAKRSWGSPCHRDDYIGFRLAAVQRKK